MPFLRANVNPQIHANVMCPLLVLNFILETLFVHVPDIVHFLKFLLSTLVNKICWYCKCGTDRKYTETNNNVYIAVLMIFYCSWNIKILIKYLNLILWNFWTKLNQIWLGWSLCGLLLQLCLDSHVLDSSGCYYSK